MMFNLYNEGSNSYNKSHASRNQYHAIISHARNHSRKFVVVCTPPPPPPPLFIHSSIHPMKTQTQKQTPNPNPIAQYKEEKKLKGIKNFTTTHHCYHCDQDGHDCVQSLTSSQSSVHPQQAPPFSRHSCERDFFALG